MAAALIAIPAHAASTPSQCKPASITKVLLAAKKLTKDSDKFGEGVDGVRCGDVTGDGTDDAIFLVSSGGTAGDTHWGVLDGKTRKLISYIEGYKIGTKLVPNTTTGNSVDIIQPVYKATDGNCCPSSYAVNRYRYNGTKFIRTGKTKRYSAKNMPTGFYGP